jgi:hypothetical protein
MTEKQRVAANILKSSHGQVTSGGCPAWGLDGVLTCSCEHGNEPLGLYKRQLLDQLSSY